MTDKLSPLQDALLARADSIFGAISSAVGQAKDLAIEQLPDIAYQYIAYNRAYLTFIILASIIAWLTIQVFITKWANKACLDNNYNKGKWNPDQGFPWFFTTLFSTIICGFSFVMHIKDFFMVWFAPKIFLIEHIVQLVKH